MKDVIGASLLPRISHNETVRLSRSECLHVSVALFIGIQMSGICCGRRAKKSKMHPTVCRRVLCVPSCDFNFVHVHLLQQSAVSSQYYTPNWSPKIEDELFAKCAHRTQIICQCQTTVGEYVVHVKIFSEQHADDIRHNHHDHCPINREVVVEAE
jgi:hypothetical protein